VNANYFPGAVRKLSKAIEDYCLTRWPSQAGKTILRFINGNFRAQGWQGATFVRWKVLSHNKTILVRKGLLRGSFRQSTAPGTIKTWSTSKYAAVHNRGFKGTVTVKEHTRRKYTTTKVGTGRYTKTGKERMKTVHQHTGNTTVKRHTRKMVIPKNQFMPEQWDDSPVLVNALRRQVVKEIQTLTKHFIP
jgi:phage gpG-like protein